MAYQIRPIEPPDDPRMEEIIRTVMTEFGAVGEGYSINDPEVGHMFETYQAPGHNFFVVERDGVVQGGGGIGALPAAEPTVCELKKMYFLPALRGMGAGKATAQKCLDAARTLGYTQCYLETVVAMTAARQLYRKLGFADLDKPVGHTGHSSCNRWMMLDL